MLLPGLAAIRETVREQGVSSYLGLICGYWYEFSLANAPQSYGFDFKNKSVTFIDDGLTKMNTSTGY
jgi:hypothetical protein